MHSEPTIGRICAVLLRLVVPVGETAVKKQCDDEEPYVDDDASDDRQANRDWTADGGRRLPIKGDGALIEKIRDGGQDYDQRAPVESREAGPGHAGKRIRPGPQG
jgi:hypothetical protein